MTNLSASSNSAAKLFVRYLLIGLAVTILAVVTVKLGIGTSYVFPKYQPIVIASAIVLINLIVIFGYAKAVLRDKALLYEIDSADYAYYLGFSLTVATLSIIFFSSAIEDAFREVVGGDPADIAKRSGDTVKNSLAQFAAGLTATFIGLSTRIYLSSLQNMNQREPEELLMSMREEISTFNEVLRKEAAEYAQTMRNEASQYSETVKESNKLLKKAASDMTKSAALLAEDFKKSSEAIEGSLNGDELRQKASGFIAAIAELEKTSQGVVGVMAELEKNSKGAVGAIAELKTTTLDLIACLDKGDVSVDELSQSIGGLSSALTNLSKVPVSNLSTELSSLNAHAQGASQSIRDLRQVVDRDVAASVKNLSSTMNSFQLSGINTQLHELEAALKLAVTQLATLRSAEQTPQPSYAPPNKYW